MSRYPFHVILDSDRLYVVLTLVLPAARLCSLKRNASGLIQFGATTCYIILGGVKDVLKADSSDPIVSETFMRASLLLNRMDRATYVLINIWHIMCTLWREEWGDFLVDFHQQL